MNKGKLKKALKQATKCSIQHTGWPCGTCFFSLPGDFTNEDWQSLLYFRGDSKKEELNNLPLDWKKRIEKIYDIASKN